MEGDLEGQNPGWDDADLERRQRLESWIDKKQRKSIRCFFIIKRYWYVAIQISPQPSKHGIVEEQSLLCLYN